MARKKGSTQYPRVGIPDSVFHKVQEQGVCRDVESPWFFPFDEESNSLGIKEKKLVLAVAREICSQCVVYEYCDENIAATGDPELVGIWAGVDIPQVNRKARILKIEPQREIMHEMREEFLKERVDAA